MNIEDVVKNLHALKEYAKEAKENSFYLSGKTRIKLASNILELEKHSSLWENERIELIKQLGKPLPEKPDTITIAEGTPEHGKFLALTKEMLAVERDVKLEPIDFSELMGKDGDENDVSIELIKALMSLKIVKK